MFYVFVFSLFSLGFSPSHFFLELYSLQLSIHLRSTALPFFFALILCVFSFLLPFKSLFSVCFFLLLRGGATSLSLSLSLSICGVYYDWITLDWTGPDWIELD